MAEIAAGAKSGKVVIKNIGLLLSGDIDKPILDADTIVVNDGLIVAVGKEKDCDLKGAKTVIDVKKTCVAPGLIDSHVHRCSATGRRARARSAGSTPRCTAA
jgi:enamidase